MYKPVQLPDGLSAPGKDPYMSETEEHKLMMHQMHTAQRHLQKTEQPSKGSSPCHVSANNAYSVCLRTCFMGSYKRKAITNMKTQQGGEWDWEQRTKGN